MDLLSCSPSRDSILSSWSGCPLEPYLWGPCMSRRRWAQDVKEDSRGRLSQHFLYVTLVKKPIWPQPNWILVFWILRETKNQDCEHLPNRCLTCFNCLSVLALHIDYKAHVQASPVSFTLFFLCFLYLFSLLFSITLFFKKKINICIFFAKYIFIMDIVC